MKNIINESKKLNNFTQEEKDQIAQLVYEYLVLEDGDGSHKLVRELFKLLWGYFKRVGKPGPWQKR